MSLGFCGPAFSECYAKRAVRQAGMFWYVPSLGAWLSITLRKAVHHDCPWCGHRLPHPPSAELLAPYFLAPDVWDEGEG